MVDTERPANVQTLRALFAQREKTVIDGLKIPKNISSEELNQDEDQIQHPSTVDQFEKNPNLNNHRLNSGSNSASSSSPTQLPKPPVGPKPTLAKISNDPSKIQGTKNLAAYLDGSDGMYTSKTSLASSSKSNKVNSSQELVKNVLSQNATYCDNKVAAKEINGETHATLIKKERLSLSIVDSDIDFNEINLRKPSKAPPKPVRNSLINCNNYISKKREYRRKSLPSLRNLGPIPSKPVRPGFITVSISSTSAPPLPERNEFNHSGGSLSDTITSPPPLPDRILSSRQSIPPPRPSGPPPLSKGPPNRPPPTPPPVDDDLYCDTLDPERAQSLIAEYTEEEECGTRRSSMPVRPKIPPPPPPSSQSNLLPANSSDDYSQDTQGSSSGQDDIYEEMPCDSNKGPVYSNSKEQERQRKEDQKRSKREMKEKEKREKMSEKLRKKYGLTGEEIPVDAGTVKTDCRGSKTDLTVHKGEMVLILRMENNPVGKWLAKNEKGKIGYVDLANIEVDADSVKSVMKVRVSQALDEEVYSEIQTEDVYECTY